MVMSVYLIPLMSPKALKKVPGMEDALRNRTAVCSIP